MRMHQAFMLEADCKDGRGRPRCSRFQCRNVAAKNHLMTVYSRAVHTNGRSTQGRRNRTKRSQNLGSFQSSATSGLSRDGAVAQESFRAEPGLASVLRAYRAGLSTDSACVETTPLHLKICTIP